jgi:hypothetical protein
MFPKNFTFRQTVQITLNQKVGRSAQPGFTCFLALIFCLFTIIQGQESGSDPVLSSASTGRWITLAYLGETLTHPGLLAGWEKSAGTRKVKKFSVGTYLHVRHQAVIFVSGELALRFRFKGNYSPELSAGLGYLHAWPHGGPIYITDEDEEFRKVINWGRPALMPSISLTPLGLSYPDGTGRIKRFFICLSLFGQFPFNGYLRPHPAITTGITFQR